MLKYSSIGPRISSSGAITKKKINRRRMDDMRTNSGVYVDFVLPLQLPTKQGYVTTRC